MKIKTIVRFTDRLYSCCGFFILAVGLCWFALSPALKAGCPNPPGVCFGQNTAVGEDSLFNVTTGVWNVGVGVQALFHDTVGNQNTGVGYQTLFNNVDGDKSTAIGSQALFNNTSGSDNVGIGFRTLFTNTMGNRNTGMGYRTLAFNDTGNDNTAVGWNALFNNRDVASFNTAVGSEALLHNTTGGSNTAIGGESMVSNTTGSENTAVGANALFSDTTGQLNTAVGSGALGKNGANITGHDNTAVGVSALPNNTTGNNNIAVGSFAGQAVTTSSNVICIGVQGSDTNNSCFIGQIFNASSPGGSGVFIDANNKLGTITSSKRFKEDIKAMDNASEALFALKPVTFHYKKDIDPAGTQQLGLVAEDVEKVNPDLVVRDKQGKPYSVRYDQVNAMLLNEFLKEHRKVEEQEATIAQLNKNMETVVTRLKEQAAQIQKVSAQLEVNKAAPQTVMNNR